MALPPPPPHPPTQPSEVLSIGRGVDQGFCCPPAGSAQNAWGYEAGRPMSAVRRSVPIDGTTRQPPSTAVELSQGRNGGKDSSVQHLQAVADAKPLGG